MHLSGLSLCRYISRHTSLQDARGGMPSAIEWWQRCESRLGGGSAVRVGWVVAGGLLKPLLSPWSSGAAKPVINQTGNSTSLALSTGASLSTSPTLSTPRVPYFHCLSTLLIHPTPSPAL